MTTRKKISEAPESNAGDDFHVLWTIKKSFDLLNFDGNGLKAISVEGINPKNASIIDPIGNKLLGVDIVEYYGGEDFEKANSVIVSQIKYSTRRAENNLTFYDLYKGKKGKSYDGSIIHRLAQIYKAHLDEFGRKSALEKIKIKLISRRDISKSQKEYLYELQKYLSIKPTKTHVSTLLKLNSTYYIALKKMHSATKLKSIEFTDFLRILDISDCGLNSRYAHEIEIVTSINKYSTSSKHQFNSLYLMVSRKMMPESQTNFGNIITVEDLLHCFELSSVENLFPISQKFEELDILIDREQLANIIDEINNDHLGHPICLHGEAGIGKSIITQLISNHLSNGSVVILFDCYGAGAYLNPSDKRHTHKEALLHISNEIAKKIGSPFLLSTNNDPYIFIREFKTRVECAIRILKSRNSEAKLVLVVDAADNSVIAAEKNQTRSFVQDLVKDSFPEGFRLVVTSRTYRVSTLNLPNGYIDIPIKPFSQEETKKHLKSYFPEISNEKVREFHDLTNGNPRVQAYALDLKKHGIEEVINYLKPNGKSVEDLIEDKVLKAAKKLGDDGHSLIDTFFTYLITLARPVPLPYIGHLCEIDESILQDLTIDIWHGLILENYQLSFRDEDFENYIRQKYKADLQQLEKVSQLLIEKANQEEYASVNLGIALYEARNKEKLKSIVLNKECIALPADPLRNKEIYIERTKLAMKVSGQDTDNSTFFKLSLIAAEAAKTDLALKNLLISNPELVVLFGVTTSLHKIHLESEGKSWSGSFHYQLAAIYSRNSQYNEIAKRHLKTAEKWVEWWRRQKKDERNRNYQITLRDIANGAEAYLRIFGVRYALSWLNHWSPKTAVFNPENPFIENILKLSNKKEIIKWITSVDLRLDIKIFILTKASSHHIQPFDISEIAENLTKIISKGVRFEKPFIPIIIDFCELLVSSENYIRKQIFQILETINVSLPKHIPSLMENSFSTDSSELEMDLCLRKETLLATLNNTSVKVEDFYPESFKDIEKERNYKTRESRNEEKRRFDRFYKHAISIYQRRADAFYKKNDEEFISKFNETCNRIKDDGEWRYYDSPWIQYKLNFLALKISESVFFFNQKKKLIRTIIDSFVEKNQNKITLRIAIAKKVVFFENAEGICLKLLDEADNLIQESSLTSNERVSHYIQCSQIALLIDKSVGKTYFDKAVEAVTEIDIEAQEQIKCISSISDIGLPKDNPQLAYEFSRFVEFCNTRLSGYDHFPLTESVEGITNMDSASSFAIICRWNHRGVTGIPEVLLSLLERSLLKDFITPTIGSSLLPINIYYWRSFVTYNKILISKYDSIGNGDYKDYYIQNLLRDLQINCSPHEKEETTGKLNELIKNGKYVSQDTILNLNSYREFIDTVIKKKGSYDHPIQKKISIDEESQETFDSDNVDALSTSSIENALREVSTSEDSYFSRPLIDNALFKLKEKCTPKVYIGHLDALLAVDTSIIDFYSFEKAYKERLEEWDYHPLVKEWKKDKFKYALKIWFKHFHWNDTIDVSGLRKFADIFSINDYELSDTVIEILPEKIDLLSATSIYQILILLKERLTPNDNESIIIWILNQWNSQIKDDFGDGIWNDSLEPSADSNQVIAQFIRYLLGHPDLRIRWRGAHSLRRLVNSGNIEILKILLKEQNKKDCFPFQHRDYTFFWISAKLYLWITIARLSNEIPETIKKVSNSFINELQNKELPHVLIQYFIKQACIKLQSFDNSTFSDSDYMVISNSLISKYNPVKEDRLTRTQIKYNQKKEGERRFKFDSLDTLPYWYNNLGHLFNLSEYDVADLADRYITEKWGYVGDPYNDNHVHTSSSRDYHLTSNSHGSLPTIEDLRTYYEYHAMFCAASDLLEKEPLLEDSWDSWDSWLKSKALVWEKFWLSDLRDPIPLDLKFWSSEYHSFDKDWLENVEQEKYDIVIGLKDPSDEKFIIPYGSYKRYFGKNFESTTIRSAIVSPKTSEALLRALQTAKNNHDYRIPLENDELEIREQEYCMIGWLKEIRSDNGNLDQKDPFSNDIGEYFITFGKEVHNLFRIKYSENLKKAFYNNDIVMSYQNWSDLSENNSYDKFESSGSIVQTNVEFLLEFLSKINKCMIIKCVISRRIDVEYDNWKEVYKENVKLYLIYPNGTVKTIRGRNYKIGQKNRK